MLAAFVIVLYWVEVEQGSLCRQVPVYVLPRESSNRERFSPEPTFIHSLPLMFLCLETKLGVVAVAPVEKQHV